MYEKLEKFICGGCGNDKYWLYKQEDNNEIIVTVCTHCKSHSEITITKPKIEVNWGKTGDGNMCIF